MKPTTNLSVVVPVYNEAAGIKKFHDRLVKEVAKLAIDEYEIIYCNDGSKDDTLSVLKDIARAESECKILSLSKNFGKEAAVMAGLQTATGKAVILMDADGQHPISALSVFYDAWKNGAQVVVGHRTKNDHEEFFKKLFSTLFYASYNGVTGNKLDRQATDYRLLDREVVDAYCGLSEANRLNRFLIDWLGFERQEIPITREKRIAGSSKFTGRALTRLAVDTFLSTSVRPLYALLVVGACIATVSFIVGVVVGIEQVVLSDPLGWDFTGTALLSILLLFLVGLLLISQGIVSLYIAATYRQVKGRPLYVINRKQSYNLDDTSES